MTKVTPIEDSRSYVSVSIQSRVNSDTSFP